ncbi:S41 family peptidase [Kiloniella laminariae]|uniref:S41 family peptidase n=1 Tax=Kiloniella laminariae TaxID=454162 RepID=UPI000381E31C|nr:S41 family peptidase [Kiloniella laminariae]
MPFCSFFSLRSFKSPLFLRRWISRLALLFLITACSAPYHPSNQIYDKKTATSLFSQGFDYVTEYYIDEIDVSRLALAGLDNLSTIDPDVEILDSGNALTVSYDGVPLSRYSYPDNLNSRSWALLTASAIESVKQQSPDFQQATGEQIYLAVFDGVVGELDRFSRYSAPEQATNNRDSRNGFGGLGIRYVKEEQGAHIISVMENTPAESVGLKAGDIIIEVNHSDIRKLSEDSITHLLKGPENSRVSLTVLRKEAESSLKQQQLTFEVTRQRIVIQTITYTPHDNIAYIQISGFNKSTTTSLRSKVRKAQKEMGKNLKGYILDLRNNGGGLLSEAISAADLFIPSGTLVSTRGRHPDSHQYNDAHSTDFAQGLPVIVLVNAYSASSSEILAAALQDSERAIVVGSNSFGKGTVQKVFELPNRSEIAVTWARFHAPSGYAIQGRGIIPDICTTRSNTRTVDDVIAQLKSGTLPISSETRTLSLLPEDEDALEKLKATCPQSAQPSDLEEDVAEMLLTTPALLSLAKGELERGKAREIADESVEVNAQLPEAVQ